MEARAVAQDLGLDAKNSSRHALCKLEEPCWELWLGIPNTDWPTPCGAGSQVSGPANLDLRVHPSDVFIRE